MTVAESSAVAAPAAAAATAPNITGAAVAADEDSMDSEKENRPAEQERPREEGPMREASEVYLLMHRNCRVSRNIRANWYFEHLGQPVSIFSAPTDLGDEMLVYGMRAAGGEENEQVGDEELIFTKNTRMFFFAKLYRQVYVLDLSPSTLVADDEAGCCLFTLLIQHFKACIYSLTRQMVLPGKQLTLRPAIYLTVLVYTPYLTFNQQTVLVQGTLVNHLNVKEVVEDVEEKFNKIVHALHKYSQPIVDAWGRKNDEKRREHTYRSTAGPSAPPPPTRTRAAAMEKANRGEPRRKTAYWDGVFEEDEEKEGEAKEDPPGARTRMPSEMEMATELDELGYARQQWSDISGEATASKEGGAVFANAASLPPVEGYIHPEWSLIFMIRMAILAIQMLPENTQSNIILITDAVCGMPEPSALHDLLVTLRTFSIACSFIQVQGRVRSEPSFGHVASCELFHFLAVATFGAYLPNCKCIMLDCKKGLNTYQKQLMCFWFGKALQRNIHILSIVREVNEMFADMYMNDIRRHTESRLHYVCSVRDLMYVRLREGYTIREIRKYYHGTVIVMILPIRQLTCIEYTIAAKGKFEYKSRQNLKAEVTLIAPFNVMQELVATQSTANPTRQKAVRAYRDIIDGIVESDRILTHLHSFYTEKAYFTIPEGLSHSSIALFRNDRYSVQSELDYSYYSQDRMGGPRFDKFWQQLIDVEERIWQKWTHTHHLRLLLKPTERIFKVFSNKDETIDFRRSLKQLHLFLMKESSFCLLHEQIYVCFVNDPPTHPPRQFYVLRLTGQPPLVSLRVSFIGGMTNHIRVEIIRRLSEGLCSLKFARGPEPVEAVNDENATPAATLLRRPIERMMMTYKGIPSDVHSIIASPSSSDAIPSVSEHNALAKFLQAKRVIWKLASMFSMRGGDLPPQVTDYFADMMLRRRLALDYQLVWMKNRIVGLCRQSGAERPSTSLQPGEEMVTMSEESEVALDQLIIFPPIYERREVERISKAIEDSHKDGCPAAKVDVVIVQELWLEPGAQTDKSRRVIAEEVLLSSLFTIDKLLRICAIGGAAEPVRTFSKHREVRSGTETRLIQFSLGSLMRNSQRHMMLLPFHCPRGVSATDLRRVDMLMEVLHEQLRENSECTLRVEEKHKWTEMCGDLERATTSFADINRGTPFILYMRKTSPWSVVGVAVPADREKVRDWRDGALPLLFFSSEEPAVALAALTGSGGVRFIEDLRKADGERGPPTVEVPDDLVLRWRGATEGGGFKSFDLTSYVRNMYENLIMKCMVTSMFEAVNQGIHVSEKAMQDVTEECCDFIQMEIEGVDSALHTYCHHAARGERFHPKPIKTISNFMDRDEETLKVLQEEIVEYELSFSSILSRYFDPVPGCPSYYHFNSNDRRITQATGNSRYLHRLAPMSRRNRTADLLNYDTDEEEERVFYDTVDGSVLKEKDDLLPLRMYSMESSDESARGSLENIDDLHDVPALGERKARFQMKEQYPTPIFLYFSCGIQLPSGEMETFPISSLPSCIHHLVRRANLPVDNNIDMDKVRVSLDLYMLTWPIKLDAHMETVSGGSSYAATKRSTFLKLLPFKERAVLERLSHQISYLLEQEMILMDSRRKKMNLDRIERVSRFVARELKERKDEGRGRYDEKIKRLGLVIATYQARKRFQDRLEGMTVDYTKLRRVAKTGVFFACKVEDHRRFERHFLLERGPVYVMDAEAIRILNEEKKLNRRKMGDERLEKLRAQILKGMPTFEEAAEVALRLRLLQRHHAAAREKDEKEEREEEKKRKEEMQMEAELRAKKPLTEKQRADLRRTKYPIVLDEIRKLRGDKDAIAAFRVEKKEAAERLAGWRIINGYEDEDEEEMEKKGREKKDEGREGGGKLDKAEAEAIRASLAAADEAVALDRLRRQQRLHEPQIGGGRRRIVDLDSLDLLKQDVTCDFWLIVKIEEQITIQFCQRYANFRHSTLFDEAWRRIKRALKITNQEMLLEKAHETMEVNSLLLITKRDRREYGSECLPDESSCIDVDPDSTIVEEEIDNSRSQVNEAAHFYYQPGFFACPMVHHHWFVVPPRIKKANLEQPEKKKADDERATLQSQLDRSSSREQTALEILRGVLAPFAATNIENVYLFKDANGSVFYMHLHTSADSVSKTCKILPLGLKSEIKEGLFDTHLLLSVHGVGKPNEELTSELPGLLQKALNVSHLEKIVSIFKKNKKALLDPPDVMFIQPNASEPTRILRFSIPPAIVRARLLTAFMFYLRQHLTVHWPMARYRSRGAAAIAAAAAVELMEARTRTICPEPTTTAAPPAAAAAAAAKPTTGVEEVRIEPSEKEESSTAVSIPIVVDPPVETAPSEKATTMNEEASEKMSVSQFSTAMETPVSEENVRLPPAWVRDRAMKKMSGSVVKGKEVFEPHVSAVTKKIPADYRPIFNVISKPREQGSSTFGFAAVEVRMVTGAGCIMPSAQTYGEQDLTKFMRRGDGGRAETRLTTLYDRLTHTERSELAMIVKRSKRQRFSRYKMEAPVTVARNASDYPHPYLLEVVVWEMGDVGCDYIEKAANAFIKQAFCDVLSEYCIFVTPFIDKKEEEEPEKDPLNPVILPVSRRGTPGSTPPTPHSLEWRGERRGGKETKMAYYDDSDGEDHCGRKRLHEHASGMAGSDPNLMMMMMDGEGEEVFDPNLNNLDDEPVFICGDEEVRREMAITSLDATYLIRLIDWFDYVQDRVISRLEAEETNDWRSMRRATVECASEQGASKAMDVMYQMLRGKRYGRSETVPDDVSILELSIGASDEREAKYKSATTVQWKGINADMGIDLDEEEPIGQPPSVVIVSMSRVQYDEAIEYARKTYLHRVRKKDPTTFAAPSPPDALLEIRREDSREQFQPRWPIDGHDTYVPRSRLIFFAQRGKKVTLYSYNLRAALHDRMHEDLITAVQWNEAKMLLLRQIGLQKMGIVHLAPNTELPTDQGGPFAARIWRCTESYLEPADFPPGHSCEITPKECILNMSRLYRGIEPAFVTANLLQHCYIEDQLEQLKQIRQTARSLLLPHHYLSALHNRMMNGKDKITYADLSELISASREMHFVMTPMLLFPAWRRKMAGIRAPERERERLRNATAKTRNVTMSSGISLKGNPSGKGRHASSAMSPSLSHGSILSLPPTGRSPSLRTIGAAFDDEDPHHLQLEQKLMKEYTEYLASLGMKAVNIESYGRAERQPTGSGGIVRWNKHPEQWMVTAVEGGLLLAHLCFTPPYFHVRFRMWHLFGVFKSMDEEAERMKMRNLERSKDELISACHVHSFTYDFHLRIMSKYLLGRDHVNFMPGYNTSAFLVDFLQYYGCRPPCARNCIYEERQSFELQHGVKAKDVWAHFLHHDKIYGWRAVKMKQSNDEGNQSTDDFMVVQSAVDMYQERDEVKIVVQDRTQQAPTNVLNLVIYMVMVNKSHKTPLSDERRREDSRASEGEFRHVAPFHQPPPAIPGAAGGEGYDGGERQRESSGGSGLLLAPLAAAAAAPATTVMDREIERMVNLVNDGYLPSVADGSISRRRRVSSGAPPGGGGGLTIPKGDDDEGGGGQSMILSPRLMGDADSMGSGSFTAPPSPSTRHPPDGIGGSTNTLHPVIQSNAPRRHRRREESRLDPYGLPILEERATYVHFLSSRQRRLQKIVEDATTKYRLQLQKCVQDAEFACRRDTLWLRMVAPEAAVKKESTVGFFRTAVTDGWQVPRMAAVGGKEPGRELDTLVSIVHKERMAEREEGLQQLLQGVNCAGLCRHLVAKFGVDRCRFYEYKHAAARKGLLIINPNCILDAAVMVMCTKEKSPELVMLIKEYDDEKDESMMSEEAKQFKQKSIDTAFDEVVSTVIAYVWSTLSTRLEV